MVDAAKLIPGAAAAAAALTQPGAELVVHEQLDKAGQLLSRATLGGGELQGEMTRFGETGNRLAVAPYADGRLQGLLRIFDDKSQPVQEAEYRLGLQHGITRSYADGRLLSQQTLVAGVPHGETLAYSKAGEVVMRQNYIKGELFGEATYLHEGSVVRRENYRQGKLEGEALDYDRDGGIALRAFYLNDLLEGPMTRYWPDGKPMEVVNYRAGKPIGKPKRYDLKGREIAQDARDGLLKRLEKMLSG